MRWGFLPKKSRSCKVAMMASLAVAVKAAIVFTSNEERNRPRLP